MNLRSGKYGEYYGSYFNESESLTNAQSEVNAKYIFSYLSAEGWTKQAVSALLGNMQAESAINPGRWQSNDVGNYSMGYGLVQWTPASKYTEWCSEHGYSDPSEMDNNLKRIVYEVKNKIQWYATESYNISFSEFSKSTQNPSYLAKAFLLNYERPADQSENVQNYRGSLADNWYSFLGGVTPETPDTPTTSKRNKGKFNFVLFNKRRKETARWISRNYYRR